MRYFLKFGRKRLDIRIFGRGISKICSSFSSFNSIFGLEFKKNDKYFGISLQNRPWISSNRPK